VCTICLALIVQTRNADRKKLPVNIREAHMNNQTAAPSAPTSEFVRNGGLSSGHVSLRFIKKLAFVFLEEEAPLLAEPLVTRHQQRQQQHGKGVNGVGMPVLEVILELHQNVKHVAPATDDDLDGTTNAKHKSKKGDVTSAVWDVPPRYERLREEQRAHRSAQTRVAIAASRAPWGGGAASLSSPGTTATAVAQSASQGPLTRSGPAVQLSTRSAASFPSHINPADLVTLEDFTNIRELHLSMGAAIDISSEELLRQPPHVAAYRLLPLSDCPMPIQEQSRVDDAWLFRAIAEIAHAHQQISEEVSSSSSLAALSPSIPPSEFYAQVVAAAIASVKSRLFLCWCQLFGDSGKTLLFSDAVVMELPPQRAPSQNREGSSGVITQGSRSAPADTENVGTNVMINAPVVEVAGERRNLPIHYLQERLRRQQAAGADSHLSEAQKFLKMVAQRQLLLQLELRDRQLSQTTFPLSYQEDRLGLPRPFAMTGSPGSPPSVRRQRAGVSATPRNHIDVGHAADEWSRGLRHRGVAPASEHPKNFPPATSASRYSPRGSPLVDAEDAARYTSDGNAGADGPQSFLVGGDDETFCIPKRRVRMGELGRFVEAPSVATSGAMSLGAYWQHLAMQGGGADEQMGYATKEAAEAERAGFQAASGAPLNSASPFHAVSGVQTRPPAQQHLVSRREVVGAVRRQTKHRLAEHEQSAPASAMQAAMTPGAVSSYTAGHTWTHRHKAFGSPTLNHVSNAQHVGEPVISNAFVTPRHVVPQLAYQSNSDMDDDANVLPADDDGVRRGGADRLEQAQPGDLYKPPPPLRVHVSDQSSNHHQRIESMFVNTVRELAPIRQAADQLLVDAAKVGKTIEAQLATSAKHRERHRGMLLQAKQLEATLTSIDSRLRALQQVAQ
jgi:hypothetical protein